MTKEIFFVAIGSSAGGLEAIKEFLSHLQCKDAVYIIAQHLDPKHPTILKDILERSTQLPINLLQEDTKPTLGTIYIIGSGHNAIVENGIIKISPAYEMGPKPSVNELFSSMAEDIKDKAIAIILSGTGSDGAVGIASIKAAGGITIVQDSVSAKYYGMPRSAVDTGYVDLVLSPSQIAKELPSLISTSKENKKVVTESKLETNLGHIFQTISRETSYDFSGYKLKTIQRRIERRMVVNRIRTLEQYVDLLKQSSDEVQALFRDLLISVTDFFRDKEAFEKIQEIIEEMINTRSSNDLIRIWVAGCANGAEAYSVAILFEEANRKFDKQIPFQIFASDIDESAMAIARKGVYSNSQIKGIDKELKARYFLESDNVYIVNKGIRDHVVFAKQNLISDPPFSNIDLISCRNVLIYFNSEVQKKIFRIFHYALKPKCYLFLGQSESATNSSSELFKVVSKEAQLFQRTMSKKVLTIDYTKDTDKLLNKKTQEVTQREQNKKKEKTLSDVLNETVISKLMPALIMINSNGEMLHISGDINPYIGFNPGKIQTNILAMAKGDLKVDLQSLLQQAQRDGSSGSQALFFESNDKDVILYIAIEKVIFQEKKDLFVVAFFELKFSNGNINSFGSTSLDSLSQEKLKKEIEVFKERLHSTLEEVERSNAQLQAANEELQSINEELQSTNQELQTSNEELQSTNEELSTVNEELEVKSFELGRVNNDLSAMLSSIDEHILFVDNRLRLQRYTYQAGKLFDLAHDDIGQVITSFGFSMHIPSIRSELISVIEIEEERLLKIRTGDFQNDLRIVPYKFDNEEVVGAILFFEKIQSDNECKTQELDFIKVIGQYSAYPMICLNDSLKVIVSNYLLEKLLGYDIDELKKLHLEELFLEKNDIQKKLFDNNLLDNDGWGNISTISKNGNKKVIKYKYEKSLYKQCNKKIIFFKE